MITRCPQCHAWFRVRAEHLSAAGGFVTCGDCEAVFNALLTLVDEREAHGAQVRPVPRIDEPVPGLSAAPVAAEPVPHADPGTVAGSESAPTRQREAEQQPDAPPRAAAVEPARTAPSSEDPVGDLFDLEIDAESGPASETEQHTATAAPDTAPPGAETVAVAEPASRPADEPPDEAPNEPPDEPPVETAAETPAETPVAPAVQAAHALQNDSAPPQEPEAAAPLPAEAASPDAAEPARPPDVEIPAVAALASGPAPAPAGHTLSAEDHAILFTTPGGEDDDDDDVEDTVPEYYSRAAPPVLQADLERLAGRRASPRRAAWAVGLALLALASLAQLAWLERARIVELWPASAPYVARVCSALACRDGAVEAPTSIRLLARDVREHPQYRDALLVNATLVNTAAVPRPYPVIELSLHDARGTVLGARRFAPQEYLDDSIALDAGMPPDRPVYVVMELGGDALEATSFEFTFL